MIQNHLQPDYFSDKSVFWSYPRLHPPCWCSNTTSRGTWGGWKKKQSQQNAWKREFAIFIAKISNLVISLKPILEDLTCLNCWILSLTPSPPPNLSKISFQEIQESKLTNHILRTVLSFAVRVKETPSHHLSLKYTKPSPVPCWVG